MDNKPNMFEEGIFELVKLGKNYGFNQISFLREIRSKNPDAYDILIDKKDTSRFNNMNYPHIGIDLHPFDYSKYNNHILDLIKNHLVNSQHPFYFSHYIKSLVWHSLVFDNPQFSSKVFDSNIVKTGFLSVTCKSNHEILTNLETFDMRIKIHE